MSAAAEASDHLYICFDLHLVDPALEELGPYIMSRAIGDSIGQNGTVRLVFAAFSRM